VRSLVVVELAPGFDQGPRFAQIPQGDDLQWAFGSLGVKDRAQYLASLYVDDLADACIYLMKNYSGDELVNIGTGEDITIAEFARVVAATVGYIGEISYDRSKPDGTPQKLLDVGRLARLGWRARTSLEDGIKLAYRAYLSEQKQAAE